MTIRTATAEDLDRITQVEAACFPPAEAATRAQFKDRLDHYASHFLLLFEEEKLISFVDGFVTDAKDLTDEMYENAGSHNEQGAWQMVFGVNTLPGYRGRGYAGMLLKKMIDTAHEQHRRGLVLTCKEALLPFYARLGFVSEGITDASTHGGAVWYQMRLTFPR